MTLLPSPAAPLKIGTRGSPLALAQAHETRDRLAAAFDLAPQAFEVVVIRTTGDDRAMIAADRPLKEIGNKGLLRGSLGCFEFQPLLKMRNCRLSFFPF